MKDTDPFQAAQPRTIVTITAERVERGNMGQPNLMCMAMVSAFRVQ